MVGVNNCPKLATWRHKRMNIRLLNEFVWLQILITVFVQIWHCFMSFLWHDHYIYITMFKIFVNESWCQFHQCFMWGFSYKSLFGSLILVTFWWKKKFHMKNGRVKCWWNWHLIDIEMFFLQALWAFLNTFMKLSKMFDICEWVLIEKTFFAGGVCWVIIWRRPFGLGWGHREDDRQDEIRSGTNPDLW